MKYQGYFKPKNPEKYKGDPTNIIYRSSWELKLMSYLDAHPDVVEWSSEEFCIPYRSPKDNRIHRYYPDFKIKQKKDGKLETLVIEVKPYNQSVPPERGNKTKRTFLNEVITYGINQAKWKAAQEYCENRMWKFMVMTEKDLGIK